MIHGKTIEAWCASHPLIRDLVALPDGVERLAGMGTAKACQGQDKQGESHRFHGRAFSLQAQG